VGARDSPRLPRLRAAQDGHGDEGRRGDEDLKRAGSYVTLRELIDEVGRDAARFFLVSRKADTEFVFDIDLAKSQSEENPVYYVQYAHARICSVLEQWRTQFADRDRTLPIASSSSAPGCDPPREVDLAPLTGARELALLQRLASTPRRWKTQRSARSAPDRFLPARAGRANFTVTIMLNASSVAETPLRSARLALCLAAAPGLAQRAFAAGRQPAREDVTPHPT